MSIKARLLNDLPFARYKMFSDKGDPPKKGDLLQLDQGFTSEDGKAIVLAYCIGEDGSYLYEAEVYEFELE